MKTPNHIDRGLQFCFLIKITIGLLWNVLSVVQIISKLAHKLELMQAVVILLAVSTQ